MLWLRSEYSICDGCRDLAIFQLIENWIDQAELLKAKAGDAGLLVERLGSLPDGRAIEFSQSFYRGDTYDFVAELSAST